jgi:hypothetical protein
MGCSFFGLHQGLLPASCPRVFGFLGFEIRQISRTGLVSRETTESEHFLICGISRRLYLEIHIKIFAGLLVLYIMLYHASILDYDYLFIQISYRWIEKTLSHWLITEMSELLLCI